MASILFGLNAVAPFAMAAGAFDGAYAGIPRQTKNDNSETCLETATDTARITIQNSVINYQWGHLPMKAKVDGGGSFSVRQLGPVPESGPRRTVTLKGKISGGILVADVGNKLCATHLSLKKGADANDFGPPN
jgi:hypothetical protein